MGGSEQIEERGGETETFANLPELTALAAKWSAARLADIWRSIPGVQPVQRFTNRQVATTRIWNALQRLGPSSDEKTGRVVAKRSRVAKKAPGGAQKREGAARRQR